MSNIQNVLEKDKKISNNIAAKYPPVPEGENVLYIVGSESDFNLMCTLWDTFDEKNRNVFVYGTDLRRVVLEMCHEGTFDEKVDLLQVLKDTEWLAHKKYQIDQEKYDYIYMIFDFDPLVDQALLAPIMEHFSDPKGRGKMYLNYPTVDSFRHVVSENDEEFLDRLAGERMPNRYKNLVDRTCLLNLRVVDNCDEATLKKLVQMHLMKTNYILNGDYELPTKEMFLSWKGTDILEAQYLTEQLYDDMYVLNTSVFNIVEMMPEIFLEQ